MKLYYTTEKDNKKAEVYELDKPTDMYFKVLLMKDDIVIVHVYHINRVRAIREAVMFTGVDWSLKEIL